LRTLVRQPPPVRQGYPAGRWRLVDIGAALPALAGYGISGLSRLVRRAGIRLKRGRLRIHSPDPAYQAKAARVDRALALARCFPERISLVFADEAGVARQPTLAPTWYPVGAEPTAPRSPHANVQHRICAGLDAVTGQLTWLTDTHITVERLCQFLEQLRQTYPQHWLWVVWDNWPVHRHPTVSATAARLHIHLLWLPTYAPWLNPIEKLWRWLKQEIAHCHRLADQWEELKEAVGAFLDRFATPSPDLLRYTGLCAH
jgi:transposase